MSNIWTVAIPAASLGFATGFLVAHWLNRGLRRAEQRLVRLAKRQFVDAEAMRSLALLDREETVEIAADTAERARQTEERAAQTYAMVREWAVDEPLGDEGAGQGG